METPCPPYYAEPTHAKTLVFSTSSYVRNYNDWYQCIEGAYCNSPAFLGYNPPGEGKLWQEAWVLLDEGYPCNPALENNSSGKSSSSSAASAVGSAVRTARPTNEPTKYADLPSLISGVVWYDSNGDGMQNSLQTALTRSEYLSASNERGAGLSNMKITLRECNTNKLLGVTHSFPIAFGFAGEGDVEVIDASYLEQIELQNAQSSLYSNIANDGLGIGNTEGRLGFYSFRILRNQLPGEFYVVFEAPEGYRLTGGSGNYWEVYEAAMYDDVQPLMEATWGGESNRKTRRRTRHLQENTEDATDNSVEMPQNTTAAILNRPKGPINHSGYYARSKCLSIQNSPTMLPNIDAGLTEDSWPLVPFQYASLVVTIKFYSRGRKQIRRNRTKRQRQRKLQGATADSLECRKYQKMKSDGIEVEDIWGCEQGQAGGSGPQIEYEELTLDEAEQVVLSFKAFLESRVSRSWSIKYVGLAHQKVINLLADVDDEDDEGNRRLDSASPEHRDLQVANTEVAHLELGFRVQAEYTSSRGGDLTEVIMSSINGGAESFLAGLRGLPVGAGGVEVRDILWQPEKPKPKKKEDEVVIDATSPEDATQQGEGAIDNGGSTSTGMLIGITVGVVGVFAIIAAFLLFQRRRKKAIQEAIAANRRLAMARTGGQRRLSVDDSKWQQGKNKLGGAAKKVGLGRKARAENDSEESSEYEEDSWDDLSSRFYSDSSKFDPTTRAAEVGGYGDEGVEDWNSESGTTYESGSQSYGASGSRGERSDGSSYETGLQSSYASGYSSRTPSVRSGATRGSSSRKSRRSHKSYSMHSSATSGRSSTRSGARSNRSHRTSSSSQASGVQASDLYGSTASRQWGQDDDHSSSGVSSADAYSASMDSRSTMESNSLQSSQGRSQKSSIGGTSRSRRVR